MESINVWDFIGNLNPIKNEYIFSNNNVEKCGLSKVDVTILENINKHSNDFILYYIYRYR